MNKEVDKLVNVLKEFSIQDTKEIEENLDKQFIALKNLYENTKDPLFFLKAVVINALLSYQLSMRGEEYWQKFSEFFSQKRDLKYFEEFLSIYNKRFLNSKLKRLNKVKSFFENLTLKDFDFFVENPVLYLEKIANFLGQKKEDKTIVFSLKMLYYAYRIIKKEFKLFPYNVMIPIDVRIGKINKDKGFWKNLEKNLGIPLLHLDSIIWVTKGLKEDEINRIKNKELKKKLMKLKSLLNNY